MSGSERTGTDRPRTIHSLIYQGVGGFRDASPAPYYGRATADEVAAAAKTGHRHAAHPGWGREQLAKLEATLDVYKTESLGRRTLGEMMFQAGLGPSGELMSRADLDRLGKTELDLGDIRVSGPALRGTGTTAQYDSRRWVSGAEEFVVPEGGSYTVHSNGTLTYFVGARRGGKTRRRRPPSWPAPAERATAAPALRYWPARYARLFGRPE